MTEYFFRHGNILSQLSIVEDPMFLEEPLVKTTNLMLDVRRAKSVPGLAVLSGRR